MTDTACKPVILVILDGWGHSDSLEFNAIANARKPTWDGLWQRWPHTLISASGTDVGLPDQQMGNSEVGHMTIGSGRVIDQDFTRITRAIDDASFYDNEVLCRTLRKVAASGKAVHILGLLSTGGVHSHQRHIIALVELAKRLKVERIYLHAFLDGRDTAPQSAATYLQQAEAELQRIGHAHIASVVGRYYAMDRNKNWERTRAAYELVTAGSASFVSDNALEALEAAYARGETDEFVLPTAISDSRGQRVRIEDGDAILFANYRADRARQLSMAFTMDTFSAFERSVVFKPLTFVSLTEYKADFDFPVAFPPVQHRNVFGEYIAARGLRQLRISETEKYAHVTFFFNGGEERVFDNEDRILVPSPHVNTYDERPEMSAHEVADRLVAAIDSRQYHAIICNFANADMVGHTGDYAAAIRAVETLDECLHKVVDAARKNGAEMLLTADHGNAEQMRVRAADTGQLQPHTAHTNNLVPLVYVGRAAEIVNPRAALNDLAPTLLYLMGLPQPPEMTGKPVFRLTDAD